MFVLNTVLHTLGSRLGIGFFGNNTPSKNTAIETTPTDEEGFWASLARLSPEEQQRRIQKREGYKRLARRQGIMEIEENADHYWDSGSEE